MQKHKFTITVAAIAFVTVAVVLALAYLGGSFMQNQPTEQPVSIPSQPISGPESPLAFRPTLAQEVVGTDLDRPTFVAGSTCSSYNYFLDSRDQNRFSMPMVSPSGDIQYVDDTGLVATLDDAGLAGAYIANTAAPVFVDSPFQVEVDVKDYQLTSGVADAELFLSFIAADKSQIIVGVGQQLSDQASSHAYGYTYESGVVYGAEQDIPEISGVRIVNNGEGKVDTYYVTTGGAVVHVYSTQLDAKYYDPDASVSIGVGVAGYNVGANKTVAEATFTNMQVDCTVSVSEVLPLYRFWSDNFKKHFYTTKAAEKTKLETTDPNWRYESIAYNVLSANTCDGGEVVHRFYSPVFLAHFYTISAREADKLRSNDPNWNYEGEAFCAYTAGSGGRSPVYRFYSPVFKAHFFTMKEAEKDKLINNDPNWDYEGIAYHALPR